MDFPEHLDTILNQKELLDIHHTVLLEREKSINTSIRNSQLHHYILKSRHFDFSKYRLLYDVMR